MKRVEAIIKPHKLSPVSLALHRCKGVTGVTASEVRGWGHGKLQAEEHRAAERVSDFEPHARIEVICADDAVPEITEAIQSAAHTGLAGDGIVIVSDVNEVVRISTGASGVDAL